MLEYLPIIFAHVLPGDAGIIEGFLQPVINIEQLLAVVAIGLLSVQIGKRALWTIPLSFAVMMIIGGIIGFILGPAPIIAYGTALSLVLFGIAIASQKQIPEAMALIGIGIFAIFHGYAHGEAFPSEQTIIFFLAYGVGIVVSTAGLNIIATLVGFIALRSDRGAILLRILGVVIGLVGIYYLLNA